MKLKEISEVNEEIINLDYLELVESFHKLLFKSVLEDQHDEMKAAILEWSGVRAKDRSREKERMFSYLGGWHSSYLKSLCSILKLKKNGKKIEIIERTIDFLLEPDESKLSTFYKKKKKAEETIPAVLSEDTIQTKEVSEKMIPPPEDIQEVLESSSSTITTIETETGDQITPNTSQNDIVLEDKPLVPEGPPSPPQIFPSDSTIQNVLSSDSTSNPPLSISESNTNSQTVDSIANISSQEPITPITPSNDIQSPPMLSTLLVPPREPTDSEISRRIAIITLESDLKLTTLSDVINAVERHFGIDLSSRSDFLKLETMRALHYFFSRGYPISSN